MNRGRREETFLKKGFLSPPTDPSSHLPKTFDLIESLFAVFLTQILFRIREVQLWWRAVRQEFRWMTGNSKRHVLFLDLLKEKLPKHRCFGSSFQSRFHREQCRFSPTMNLSLIHI